MDWLLNVAVFVLRWFFALIAVSVLSNDALVSMYQINGAWDVSKRCAVVETENVEQE